VSWILPDRSILVGLKGKRRNVVVDSEGALTRQQRWYRKDILASRAYYRAWRAKNVEQCRARSRKWREENKEHTKKYDEKYSARRRRELREGK
jgi:hypothetical protein